MDNDLLSVSDLEAAYGRDRRTIQRRLIGVAPAEILTSATGKTVRKYRRGDVDALLVAESAGNELAAAYEELHATRADLKQLKRQLRTGEVLSAAEVRREVESRLLNLRTAILGVHARYAGTILAVLAADDPLPKLTRLFADAKSEIVGDLLAPLSWEVSP